jgi:hypothetical protein
MRVSEHSAGVRVVGVHGLGPASPRERGVEVVAGGGEHAHAHEGLEIVAVVDLERPAQSSRGLAIEARVRAHPGLSQVGETERGVAAPVVFLRREPPPERGHDPIEVALCRGGTQHRRRGARSRRRSRPGVRRSHGCQHPYQEQRRGQPGCRHDADGCSFQCAPPGGISGAGASRSPRSTYLGLMNVCVRSRMRKRHVRECRRERAIVRVHAVREIIGVARQLALHHL